MIITIFNINNGKIQKTLQCDEPHILINYDSSTEDYIEGSYGGDKYYIENKKPILIPDAPNNYSVFNHDTKQWEKNQTDEQRWELIKMGRNMRLTASDWTDTLSAKARLGDELYQQWQTYRQALRDITTQADPFNIVWPVPPGG